MLLLYTTLVRIKSILDPVAYQNEGTSPLFSYLSFWKGNPLLESIVAIFLVFIQAVIINRVCIKNQLDRQNTLIPGLFYILMVSFVPDLLSLSPQLFGMLFIILAVYYAFRVYNKHEPSKYNFNVGFFIGLAGLIYPPYFLFLIFGISNQFGLRSYNIKEMAQFLGGILALFVLYTTYYYWIGRLDNVGELFAGYSINLGHLKTLDGVRYLPFVVYTLLLLLFGLNLRKIKLKKAIHIRKKMNLLLIIYVLGGILGVCYSADIPTMISWLMPSAILLAFSFLMIKNQIIQELIHLALLVGLFVLHFDLWSF